MWKHKINITGIISIAVGVLFFISSANIVKAADMYVTLFLAAASSGNIKEVQRLLDDEGVNVNSKSTSGITALMLVCSLNKDYKYRAEMVNFLISRGANVNIGDNMGRTPLIMASIHNDVEMAKLFLEKGANVDAKTNKGVKAMTFAPPEIAKLLRDHGATGKPFSEK
jgi:ankyrin repeat protein